MDSLIIKQLLKTKQISLVLHIYFYMQHASLNIVTTQVIAT